MYKLRLFQKRQVSESQRGQDQLPVIWGNFKHIEILTEQVLGIGSYGKVCKAKCDDLLCAAKIIHPTLFDPNLSAHYNIEPHREHRLPTMRFEQECEILRTIRHPNIVLFLGMYEDPNTHLPVLLMELMDESLTHFLESSSQPIQYHVQVNICHDITRALSFLHSNKVVHRDLSSNNVLLIGNGIAKVTDFGMASFGEKNRQASKVSFTMCPGTDVYMPPEAVQDKPVYSEKIDIFSFGVLAIQILTRQFPMPGDRRKTVKAGVMGLVEQRVSETERRQNHISQADQENSLLPIALDCLKDKDTNRPFAHQLCSRIVALKGSHKYSESINHQLPSREYARMLALKDESIASKNKENKSLQQDLNETLGELQKSNQQLEEKRQLILQKEQTIAQMNETMSMKEKEFQQVKKASERQQELLSKQLKASEEALASFEEKYHELERQVKEKQQQLKVQHPEAQSLSKLLWQEGVSAPCPMDGLHEDITSDEAKVYMRHSNMVFVYDTHNQKLSRLPDCRVIDCPLVIIKGLLTTVGGYITNKLFSLTGEEDKMIWREQFLPMPTQRWRTTAVCTDSALIVAGGVGQGEGLELLTTIEVMSTGIYQWSTVASLPELLSHQSIAVCGDHVYMLGGVDETWKPTKSVYTCSLNALIQSGRKSRLRSFSSTHKHSTSIWSKVADLPVVRSTCVSFRGRLLAIGGEESDSEPSTVVYMYNPITDYWKINSYMSFPRRKCYAVAVSDKQVVVVGGLSSDSNMDIATVGIQ